MFICDFIFFFLNIRRGDIHLLVMIMFTVIFMVFFKSDLKMQSVFIICVLLDFIRFYDAEVSKNEMRESYFIQIYCFPVICDWFVIIPVSSKWRLCTSDSA